MKSQPTTDSTPSPQVPYTGPGHELTDIKPGGVIWLAIAVAVVIGLAQVAMWLLLQDYRATADANEPPRSPLANVEQVPPKPWLQPNDTADYVRYIEKQREYLNSYGWVDKSQQVAHIPIEQAMYLLLERGIQPPPAADAAPPGNTAAPPSGADSSQQPGEQPAGEPAVGPAADGSNADGSEAGAGEPAGNQPAGTEAGVPEEAAATGAES